MNCLARQECRMRCLELPAVLFLDFLHSSGSRPPHHLSTFVLDKVHEGYHGYQGYQPGKTWPRLELGRYLGPSAETLLPPELCRLQKARDAKWTLSTGTFKRDVFRSMTGLVPSQALDSWTPTLFQRCSSGI